MVLQDFGSSHELEDIHGIRGNLLEGDNLGDQAAAVDSDQREVIRTLRKVAFVCFLFFVLELAGGLISDSVAVISDALHLSIDLIGYAIQMLSAYLAMKRKFSDS